MPDTGAARDFRIEETVKAGGFRPMAVMRDLGQGLSMWRIWLSLSWEEFRSAYRRSMIGVLWVILSFAAFVFIKIVIFSSLLVTDDPTYYDSYLLIGFFVWMYMLQSMNAAPDTFTSAQGWIRSEPLPFSFYVFKAVMREVYNLILTSLVVVVAFVYIGRSITVDALWALPAIAFLLVNAISMKFLFGIVGARIRDLSHLVRAITLPLMFLTPIFWMPSQMGDLMQYLWWNPFFHYLMIVRTPVLDGTVPLESWLFAGILYGIMTVLAFLLLARYRQRIVYWF